ncbi:hypothetical protein DFH07DRAFT_764540 [Mycena maculata]|uniref:Uncharacterized protein n=1 Tax=Mycena maculata TaxID=230809 RepID=A0AAD7P089_9AGAR|nr:hypothetical protein DFH07DRAFT_764540 [Mycena maculata]
MGKYIILGVPTLLPLPLPLSLSSLLAALGPVPRRGVDSVERTCRQCQGIYSTLCKDLSSFPFERSRVLAMQAGKKGTAVTEVLDNNGDEEVCGAGFHTKGVGGVRQNCCQVRCKPIPNVVELLCTATSEISQPRGDKAPLAEMAGVTSQVLSTGTPFLACIVWLQETLEVDMHPKGIILSLSDLTSSNIAENINLRLISTYNRLTSHRGA